MNWAAFWSYSTMWIVVGPIIAQVLGFTVGQGLFVSSILYLFPPLGISLCAFMADGPPN